MRGSLQNQTTIFSKNSFYSTLNNLQKSYKNHIYQDTCERHGFLLVLPFTPASDARTFACYPHTLTPGRVLSQLEDLALGQGAAAFLHGGVTQLTGIAAPGLWVIIVSIHHPLSIP